ncbi:MAG: sensor histidine kinase [Clostridiales bacterium]|jgi:anti-sigma regulatory factor (Ser/Thr protein kinase)|nr:sensor histidine kinase [Clostridiales bacterium]
MRELSLNVMDVAQNSVAADASLITVRVMERGNRLTIEIQDNGKGMTEDQVSHVADPFFTTRTTRKVGLGVPLFKMQAEMTGGSFSIASHPGEGTAVKAEFVTSHVDMIPLGDMDATMLLLITCNPQRDFIYIRGKDGREFTLDTRQLRDVLGEEVPLNTPDVAAWIKEFLQEQTSYIEKG